MPTIAPNYEYGQSAVASFKALLKAKRPDVEFVAEQWPALAKLVREGNQRNVFPKTPRGWIVTGYPWDQIDTREHASFAAINKAKSTNNEKLVTAMRGLKFSTPFGPAEFRCICRQA